MKRIVTIFIVCILGIILTQVLGGILFVSLPKNFHTLISIIALILKLIFYAFTIYTIIQSKKFTNGIGTKIFKTINWIITILLSLVFISYAILMSMNAIEKVKYYNKKELSTIPDTAVEAKINPLVDYNGMSTDFILALRNGNIDSNFSKLTNYKPRKEIWSTAEDKGGWFSLERSICFDKNTDCTRKLKGVSAMSRLINNPMILVAPVMIATYHLNENLPVCSDEGLKLIPQNVYIDVINSKIIAVYKGTRTLAKCNYLQLSGLNARDFGFEWAKVSNTQNIKFPYPDNISEKIYQFQDSIIPGNYCENNELKCNVLSPVDDKVVFNITSYPANIELKLWNNKPFSKFTKSKFNMEIRFLEN